jgi:hypothetical protein
MAPRIGSSVAAVSGLAVILACAKLYCTEGYNFPHQPQTPGKVRSVTIEGTVEAAIPGEMRVLASKNQQRWLVVSQPGTKVLVSGKAEDSYLKAGQTVEFYAELDADDVAKEKITELSVVAPQAKDKYGVFPPEIKPADAAGDPAANWKGKHGRRRGVLTHAGSKVVGRITSRDGNKLTVHADKRTIQCELSDLPVINVSLPSSTPVKPGSQVVVHGTVGHGGRLCHADDIQVTVNEVLKGKGKRPAAKRAPETVKSPVQEEQTSGEAEEKKKEEPLPPEAADPSDY